ncbi:osteopontin isoform X2 [Peromyscus californicus insignis]|uniref:osteopontin isoform X2 n=1 Tax=Peromyscus californicus insignis TaxID=564181 RepID=UPI0022A6BE1C|nr:osteopontin isoform X2 [Peromyscus californicus insignis]
MRFAVVCFCLFGIAFSLPVKVADSGSSEKKLNVVSSEETDALKQDTLPSNSNESHDHMDDDDDDDDRDHADSQDSVDSDESDEDDHPDDSHHSDESDESFDVTTQTEVFTPVVPTVDIPDGRGDSLAYGLQSKSRKFHISDDQYPDATDEDFTSHMKSKELDDALKVIPVAHRLNVPSGKTSHESSQLDEPSVETHSHEQSQEDKQKASHESTELSDVIDSKESSKASQEDKLVPVSKSKEDTNNLKIYVSHEIESSSSEVN